AASTTNPIAVGDNDPRLVVLTASTTGIVATSSISVASTSNIFEVYFYSASSSSQFFTFQINSDHDKNAIYTYNGDTNSASFISGVNQINAQIGTCNASGANVGPRSTHMFIDNSSTINKRFWSQTYCGASSISNVFGYIATTSPITSISFSGDVTNNIPFLATSSIVVYQK
ncbi:MAG TPA: hypothetical protein VIJ25_05945, partial [Methylococcales bacterium]